MNATRSLPVGATAALVSELTPLCIPAQPVMSSATTPALNQSRIRIAATFEVTDSEAIVAL